jgi:tetratricopeptide (TPR) repeat protein
VSIDYLKQDKGILLMNELCKRASLQLRLLFVACVLLLAGCTASKAVPEVADQPKRQDLYQGQTPVAMNLNVPQSEKQALERAEDEERNGNLDKALYGYIQALDFNQTNADTFYHIARVHIAKGNIDIANRAYNEALVINPQHLLANAELGILEIDQRKYTAAREHLEQVVQIDQHRLREGQAEAAEASFIKVDSLSPLRVYNAIAILEDLENHNEMARQYFKLVLDFQPLSSVIATNMGYSHYLTGDLSTAEFYFKQALQAEPSFGRAWSNLGLIYIRKGLYSRALASFEQTMTKADALNDLGYFLMLEGRYEKAVEMFQQAIDSSPSYFERAQKNLKTAEASLLN